MVASKVSGFFIAVLLSLSLASAVPTGLIITSPTENQYFSSLPNSMSWTFSGELNSSADLCWYQLNGGAWTEFNYSQSPILGLSSIEGNNAWKIEINDSLSSITQTRNFWADSIAPIITLTTPATHPLSYTNTNTFDIIANVVETNLGQYVNKDMKIEVFDPGWTEFPTLTNYFNIGALFTYPPALPLSEDGGYTYKIYARDKYPDGTTIREINVSGTIVRDTIAPTSVTITNPSQGAQESAEVSIFSTATDDRSGIKNLSILIEQGVYSDFHSCASGSCDYNWSSGQAVDGQVNISAITYDNAENSNQTQITIDVDNTNPEIYFNSPNAGNYGSAQQVNITADDAHLQKIDLYINSVSTSTSTEKELDYALGEGQYYIYAIVTDSFGNSNQTETRSILIDLTAPILTLNGDNPQRIEFGESYTELGATSTDNFDGNLTSQIIINTSLMNINAVGSYPVSYFINDSVNNFATLNRTIIVTDTTAPTMNVSSPSPEDKHAFLLGTTFDFHVDDKDISGTIGCTLTINSADYEMASLDSWDYLNFNPDSSGKYFWNITCTDTVGNVGTSETRFFTILPALSGATNFDDYTNLSAQSDISNVLNFFVRNSFGMINWTSESDLSNGLDWTAYTNLSENRAEVNSSAIAVLNKSAEITLYGLGYTDPRILKDSSVCDDCTEISYSNGTFLFSVTGFSAYSAEETPVDSTPSSSSSGGGGGGCTTSWQCTSWTECSGGTQTRVCKKANQDCIAGAKPVETQTCTEETEGTPGITGEAIEETTSEEGAGGFLSGITGAVTGAFANEQFRTSAGAAVLVILLIASYFYIRSKKLGKIRQTTRQIASSASANKNFAKED